MSNVLGVADVVKIRVGTGRPVVPDFGPGTASREWRETEWRSFGDGNDTLYGGAWEGSPGTLQLECYPYNELCVMLTGSVALVDSKGERRVFHAGDAFFVPRGFSGVWETLEPSSKIFVALPPAVTVETSD